MCLQVNREVVCIYTVCGCVYVRKWPDEAHTSVSSPSALITSLTCCHTGLPWGSNDLPAVLDEHKDGGGGGINSSSRGSRGGINLKMPRAIYFVH